MPTSRPCIGDLSIAYFASSASAELVNSTKPSPRGSLQTGARLSSQIVQTGSGQHDHEVQSHPV